MFFNRKYIDTNFKTVNHQNGRNNYFEKLQYFSSLFFFLIIEFNWNTHHNLLLLYQETDNIYPAKLCALIFISHALSIYKYEKVLVFIFYKRTANRNCDGNGFDFILNFRKSANKNGSFSCYIKVSVSMHSTGTYFLFKWKFNYCVLKLIKLLKFHLYKLLIIIGSVWVEINIVLIARQI